MNKKRSLPPTSFQMLKQENSLLGSCNSSLFGLVFGLTFTCFFHLALYYNICRGFRGGLSKVLILNFLHNVNIPTEHSFIMEGKLTPNSFFSLKPSILTYFNKKNQHPPPHTHVSLNRYVSVEMVVLCVIELVVVAVLPHGRLIQGRW